MSCGKLKRQYRSALFKGDVKTAVKLGLKKPWLINECVYPNALIRPVITIEHDERLVNGKVITRSDERSELSYEFRNIPINKEGEPMCDAQQVTGEQPKKETNTEDAVIDKLLSMDPSEMTEAELKQLADHAVAHGWHVSQGANDGKL